KTQVITRRIAWLVATRRAKPSEILALTFTDKAAAEMQLRVDQLVPYGYTDSTIGTFHAFGDRLIRDYALELGLPSDVRVLSRAETVIFLQELLTSSGCIDFGDQVALALRLVRQSAQARAEIQARFRYVLVDEFQDTNRAQSELVSIVAEPHRNLTVVGDDDQSIYRFRGAAISNILGFRERYATTRTIVLRRNYRSRPAILEAAHRLIQFNDPDRLETRAGIPKRLTAERSTDPAGRTIRLEVHPSGGDESDRIAAEIAGRIRAG